MQLLKFEKGDTFDISRAMSRDASGIPLERNLCCDNISWQEQTKTQVLIQKINHQMEDFLAKKFYEAGLNHFPFSL